MMQYENFTKFAIILGGNVGAFCGFGLSSYCMIITMEKTMHITRKLIEGIPHFIGTSSYAQQNDGFQQDPITFANISKGVFQNLWSATKLVFLMSIGLGLGKVSARILSEQGGQEIQKTFNGFI